MKVLLVCSLGMSSAICAKALAEAAQKEGIELEVSECSTQVFGEKIKDGYSIGLVAPQIRHRYEVLKKEATEAGVPCILISPQGYTPLGGNKLLKQIKDELGELK